MGALTARTPLRFRPRNVFYGWRIVAAGSVINAVSGGIGWYGFTIFFLPLARELELGRASVALIFSASRLEGGFFGPFAGWLNDRLGPRRVIIPFAVLTGFGYLLLAQAHSFWSIFVIYVFMISLGYNAGFHTVVSATVNAWFIRYKAAAMSIVFAANGLGGFLLIPLLAWLVRDFGWRTGAFAGGLMIWALVLPAALAMQRSPESRGLYPDGIPPEERGKGASRPVDGAQDFTTRQAVRTFSYWFLTASIGIRMAATVTLIVHLVPILVWKGLSEPLAAIMVSLLALGGIAMRLLFGWIGVRISNTLLSAIGTFAAAAGVIALLTLPRWFGVLLFISGLIVVEASITMNWTTLGNFFGRRSFATLLGLMGPFHSLGAFATPIFAGWVYDRTQSYTLALVTLAGLIVVAGVMFLLLRRPKPGGGVSYRGDVALAHP